ncbi:MAG: glucosaminidase domain-containing protein [Rhodospirillales bacterium]
MRDHPGQCPDRRTYTVLGVLAVFGVVTAWSLFASREPTTETSDVETASLPPRSPLSATDIHSGLTYPLDQVAEAKVVPPVFVSSIDVDLERILDVDERKTTFFRIMLPHIARENDKIRAEREKITKGPEQTPDALFDKYKVERGDVKELLKRVDVVPASLVLSQAALESGWGTSRFARDGNNFFGMRTYDMDAKGIDPKEAEGFKVMVFRDIAASVRAYMKNLNTNSAYSKFRAARARNHAEHAMPNGRKMTDYLTSYSEIPEHYGIRLREMMDYNNLARFDGVRLSREAP